MRKTEVKGVPGSIGKYQLQKQLAKGASRTVHLATDTVTTGDAR